MPNCVSIPSVISIRKKSIDQSGAFGIVLIASVNVINAKPVLAGGFYKENSIHRESENIEFLSISVLEMECHPRKQLKDNMYSLVCLPGL